jgi:isoquinoline 1-oxidoreductase beta subunit
VIAPSVTLPFAQVFGYFPPWLQEDGYDWAVLEGMPQQPMLNPDGSYDSQYNFKSLKINYVPTKIPIEWGFWRSIGASATVFALESFLDEIARANNHDPLNLRKKLLDQNPRALAVLENVQVLANWGSPQQGHLQGMAYSDYLNSPQAQIVELSVDKMSRIKIHKITCVIDCGLMQNPHTVYQQLEGAIIFGLNSTLMGEINVKDGQIVQSNFDDYKMIRLKETPEINIHLIESKEKSGGIGEAGTPLIGPAVANAVFAATGKRVRRLPIRKEDLV